MQISIFAQFFKTYRHLVFVEHLVKSIVQLGGDGVDLHLLPDDLVLQVVNPEVQLADVHLRVLGPSLGLLQPDVDLLDLVLVLLLPLPRLLLAHLQLLLVVPDGGELVVDPVDLLLGDLDSVAGPGQLIVHHGEGARQIVVLHLIVRRYKHTA